MKLPALAVTIILVLSLSIGASAFTWVENPSNPAITLTQADPIKVYPGQSLKISAEFTDEYGIGSAIAEFHHETGSDFVPMILSAGSKTDGTYTATWVVHDTRNLEWYKTTVILANTQGGLSTADVDWQDPTVSHELSELNPGLSQDAGSTGYQFYTSSTTNNVAALVANSTGTSGKTHALIAESKTTTDNAATVFINNTATSGKSYALYAESGTTTHYAATVAINNTTPNSRAYGVYSQIKSTAPFSAAVFANETGTAGGPLYGVYGESTGSASGGYGVFGMGAVYGVYGYSPTSGIGVQGHSAQGTGVIGSTNSFSGVGVRGNGGVFSGTGVQGSGAGCDFDAVGSGTNYCTSSSIRWKEDIVQIDNALEKVLGLRGVYFNWDEEHGGKYDIGMIAEEVGEIVPEIVVYELDSEYAKSMDYSMLTPLLVEAIKEQQQQIEQLKLEVQNLKGGC